MTQEEFIKQLDEKGYSYEIEGDKVVVTHKGDVDLGSLTSLPRGVVFRNEGYVYLEYITSLSPDVEFNNGGDVWVRDIIGGFFNKWKGNIEGVDEKRLLNKMISLGLFER